MLIVPMHLCMEYNEAEGFTTTSEASTDKYSKLRDLIAIEKSARGDQIVLAWGLNTPLKPKVLAVGVLTETGVRYAWMQTPLRWIALDLEKGIDNKARWLNDEEVRQVRDWLAGTSSTINTSAGFTLEVQESKAPPTQKTLPLTPPTAESMITDTQPTSPRPKGVLPETLGGDARPQNIILHGPPGTGKTFATTRRTLELLRVKGVKEMSDADCAKHFRAFQEHGRVAFVTFHQSYGYEEFVQGLRPKLDTKGEVQYEIHEGIFTQIASLARKDMESRNGAPTTWAGASFDTIWKTLLTRAEPGVRFLSVKTAYNFVRRNDTLAYLAEEGGEYPVKRTLMDVLWNARELLGVDPQTQAVAQVIGTRGPNPNAGVYAALWRAASKIAEELVVGPVSQFVLVIDEINRGNISKILGELITLLEPDKRLGMPDALELPLAYSPGALFGVPPNLHILGTMNTADRSIALLDVALRRRFEFKEVMPQPAMIPTALEKKGVTDPAFREHIQRLLETINHRIRFLLDREHQIGHAYFLGVKNYCDLRDVFVTKIIPLLQEYFHGAWERVCMVLGCPYVVGEGSAEPRPARKDRSKEKSYPTPMMIAKTIGEVSAIGFDHDDLDNRVEYEINAAFLAADEAGLKPYFDELVAKTT